jgi:hypothetical protein
VVLERGGGVGHDLDPQTRRAILDVGDVCRSSDGVEEVLSELLGSGQGVFFGGKETNEEIGCTARRATIQQQR